MALNKMDIVDVNLNTGNIHRSFLSHTIGLDDNNADSFGVRVFRDGNPVDLSGGWVQGFFRNPRGENTALTNHGTISGNTAYVTLPQACYNYEGQFTLAIKIVSPGSANTVTMRIVDGKVDNTNTGGAVAPTETVPTYQEILATYEDMLAATTAAATAATNVGSIVAAAYSTSATYAVGDYCTKDGKLYRCTTAITTAESWTAGHWTETKVGPEVSDLKSAFTKSSNVLYGETFNVKKNISVTYDYNFVAGKEYIIINGNANTSFIIKSNGTAKYSGNLTASGVRYIGCASNCDTITFYADDTTEIILLDYSSVVLGELRDLEIETIGYKINAKGNSTQNFLYNIIAGGKYRIINGGYSISIVTVSDGDSSTIIDNIGSIAANGVKEFTASANAGAFRVLASGDETIIIKKITDVDELPPKVDNLEINVDSINKVLHSATIIAKKTTTTDLAYSFVSGKKYKLINGVSSVAATLMNDNTQIQALGSIAANATLEFTASGNANKIRLYASDDDIVIVAENNNDGLADGSVTTPKIANGAVTIEKLDPNIEIGIADGSVTTAKLANKAVTLAKLADEVGTQFTNGANIQNGTVAKAALTEALIQFIESAGGGSITNNADDLTIKVNGSNELYVNPNAFNIVFVDADTAYSSVISRISAISGKVVLMLKGNITGLANNTNFPSNLMMVIGLGGIFNTTRTADTYVYFPEGCRFVCGNYQLFNQYVMPRCTSGYLDGEAKVIWWGAVADGETVVTSIFNCLNLSTFKVLRFTPGVYRGYFNNTLDGRTLIFDEGAIIDGVVHVAYGSSLGASTKRWCKNTKVIGKVVSTVRVGGAQIDGLSIPDGIEILGTNASYHSQTSEGGPKGVHWHFGCKNIEIGEIVVHEVVNLSAGYAYALGIDTETNEETPHNIHIERVIAGENTSSYYDVLISKAYNISIGEIIAESGTGMTDSLYINNNAHDIEIGKLTTKFAVNSNGKSAVLLGNVEDVKLGTINIVPDVSSVIAAWGIFFNACRNVFVESVHTKYMAQGLRLVNAVNALVVSHISENDTTPAANSGSTYQILKTFN